MVWQNYYFYIFVIFKLFFCDVKSTFYAYKKNIVVTGETKELEKLLSPQLT